MTGSPTIHKESHPRRWPDPNRLGCSVRLGAAIGCPEMVRSPVRVIGLVTALCLVRISAALAFPLIDPTNQDQVPRGTELAEPDARDLQHQLQIVNGLSAPAGGGWTFVPRIDMQELLTDNVEQVRSPRRADMVSYFAPGFSLIGDLPRLQMVLSYAPTLAIYARTNSLDSLTQQLNGLATVTLMPDLAYVDVRALSGVQSLYGGLGGIGTVGAPAGAAATAATGTPTLAGNGTGLTRNNEVQTTSFGVSPYLLHNFGDWGTGKVGYSLDVTRSAQLSGFFAPPIPTGGRNGQTLLTNEEIAHFATGDVLQFVHNSVDLDFLQGWTSADANGTTLTGGLPVPPARATFNRAIVSDTVSYALTQDVVVFAMGGHEDIEYSNQTVSSVTPLFSPFGVGLTPVYTFTNVPATSIHDLIWSLGGTWTPGPDSSVTLSYGHQNGFNSFAANGYYQLTARTSVNASYASTLGTQLEYLQNQFNLAAPNGSAGLVNGRTGGALFGVTNALAVQEGVFRTDSLAVGSTTVLDRDIITLNLLFAKQTSSGASSISGTSKSVNAAWLHQMQPNMTVSGGLSLAIQDQTSVAVHSGNFTSIVASLAWQYQISDTVGVNLRYAFLGQQSSVAAYSVYQNILIFGVSKTF
jgi:hypothetical protein